MPSLQTTHCSVSGLLDWNLSVWIITGLFSEETETVVHSDDAFAQVAYLKFKKCSTVEKTAEEMDSSNVIVQDWKAWESFDEITMAVEKATHDTLDTPTIIDIGDPSNTKNNEKSTINNNSPFFAIAGTTAYDNNESLTFESIEEETKACMDLVNGMCDIHYSRQNPSLNKDVFL